MSDKVQTTPAAIGPEGHVGSNHSIDSADTEGHGAFTKHLTEDAPEAEDTEGHAITTKHLTEDGPEAEGHAGTSHAIDDADTEGHGACLRHAIDTKDAGMAPEGVFRAGGESICPDCGAPLDGSGRPGADGTACSKH